MPAKVWECANKNCDYEKEYPPTQLTVFCPKCGHTAWPKGLFEKH